MDEEKRRRDKANEWEGGIRSDISNPIVNYGGGAGAMRFPIGSGCGKTHTI